MIALAYPLVTGCSNPLFHGSETLAEAGDYRDNKRVMPYDNDTKYGAGKPNQIEGQTA